MSIYTGVDGQAMLVEKKEHYQWRYEKAVERLTVNVDTDGDGDADNSIMPSVIQLARR